MVDYLREVEYDKYFEIYGLKPIIFKNISQIKLCISDRNKYILLSDNKLIRGLCKILGIKRARLSEAISDVENFLTFSDALCILSSKGIPVCFYNRIGDKRDDFIYSENAKNRMDRGIDFVKISERPELYEKDLVEILGKDFSLDYVKKLGSIPQIIQKGNIFCHEDCRTALINVVDGKRITVPDNETVKRSIHVYGRCGVFGYAVEDNQTFPSRLQQKLNSSGTYDYKVVNHGIWGGDDNNILNNFFYDLSGFREGDIVLFYMKHFDKKLIKNYKEKGLYYKEITEEWHQYPEAAYCFYDKPGHMNQVGYEHVAEIIFNDLCENIFGNLKTNTAKLTDTQYLNYYLKKHINCDFTNEIKLYITEILKKYPFLRDSTGKVGAIVMNCNPFTYGHKYLIEFASQRVDKLIIFVVEEDKSIFKFADRFEMVVEGTREINNVVVVPSGKFIISTITFPEYFLKDYVKEKNFDVSQDLDTFCKFIAPELNITVRFAGEEPFDPVTKTYNESMQKIFPIYGIEFVEIPRLVLEGSDEIINATKVREMIKEKDMKNLKKYIPDTTFSIINQKYINIR